MNNYKLGSLFDGSGGFPLAGALCGIEPRWAAEVEPYPIAVTRSRFPKMKHLGDISKVSGAEIEPVDIITFGSPCTEFLMLNTGESPSVAVGSTLSQILEANAPAKYSLSAKACEGILRRAQRRGKQLPPMLKEALEQMIERERTTTASPLGTCKAGECTPQTGLGPLCTEEKAAVTAMSSQSQTGDDDWMT